MKLSTLIRLALLSACLFSATTALAELKPNQAKDLIRRVAGSALPSSAVKIRQVSDRDSATAEVTAQIETAFRFQQSESGQWEIQEVRVAPDSWEDMGVIARGIDRAAPAQLAVNACDGLEPFSGPAAGRLNAKRARCLLASYLAISLPSDAVRIREISPLALPLSSRPSATVLATVELDFRFQSQDKSAWRITAFRTQNRDWASLDRVIETVNAAKAENARTELGAVANALQNFRNQRGFYVASDQHKVLIDFLSPQFMPQVVRVDPWHRPYQYQGERDRFTLRSSGPDGKPNTSDDIVVTHP